jgi:hypothetical protein
VIVAGQGGARDTDELEMPGEPDPDDGRDGEDGDEEPAGAPNRVTVLPGHEPDD